jgi:hypothetical protein
MVSAGPRVCDERGTHPFHVDRVLQTPLEYLLLPKRSDHAQSGKLE